MSAPQGHDAVVRRRQDGVRTTAFAAVIMLLVEYGLGIWVTLETSLPHADRGVGLLSGFVRALTGGPLGVTLHAGLGALLLVTATSVMVRAIRGGHMIVTGIGAVAWGAIALAGLNGARFVGTASEEASLIMALATAAALFCYTLIVFVTPPRGAT